MIYILSGPPGAGKGTQSDLLVRQLAFKKLSTGDALRAAAEKGTEVGKLAAEIMNRGELVPDNIMLRIVAEALEGCAPERVVLEGYPRNTRQADELATLPFKVEMFILLKIADTDSVARIAGRVVCRQCNATFHQRNHPPKQEGVCDHCRGKLYQRQDDQPERVRRRIEVYRRETVPVIDYYEKKNLVIEIEADRDEHLVFKELRTLIEAGCA